MKLPKYKLTFGLLVYVISMLILSGYIIPDIWSIRRPWKSVVLFTWYNRKSPVKRTKTGEDSDFCSKKYENRTWFQTDHGKLLLNKTIYYCHVPKCGSTFLQIFLKKLFTNTTRQTADFMISIKENVNISNVYSFMFVREPYGRIFSAYENKLFNPNPFSSKLGTDIIKEVRHNPSELSLRLGHDVTFTELIQYIVKFYNQGRLLNPHITAIHTLCNPCRQKYDFIGKLETMATDIVTLEKEWHSRGLITEVKNTDQDTQHIGLYGIVGHMFKFHYMNKGLISKYKLFQRTWSNFQIRGYIHKEYKLPYNESFVKNVNINDYTKAIETAVDASKTYINQLKAQRKEALQQAYRNVPLILLETISQYLKADCEIFGYENKPSWIFNQSDKTPLGGHDYFEWI